MVIVDLMIDKDQIVVTLDIRQIVMINITAINNVDTSTQNDDPTGIDEYEYTSESSNEDQEILDKF